MQSVSVGTVPLKPARLRLGVLGWSAVAAAVLLTFPLFAVLANVLQAGGGSFAHLAATVLPRYVGNTALLLLGVSWGVISIGVLSAWLVTAYQFPGRRVLEWALMLPLAMPAYVMAYAYTDWLQFTGPVQTLLRELIGWRAREYWFPEIRSLGGAAAMLSFALYPYVYLIARTAFLDLSRAAVEAGRLAGLTALGQLLPRGGAARAAGDCGRHGARADGNAGRLRHRFLFRGRRFHHRHLQGLAVDGRQRRGRGNCRAVCWRSWPCCSHSSGRAAAARAITAGQRANERRRSRCTVLRRARAVRAAPRRWYSVFCCRWASCSSWPSVTADVRWGLRAASP